MEFHDFSPNSSVFFIYYIQCHIVLQYSTILHGLLYISFPDLHINTQGFRDILPLPLDPILRVVIYILGQGGWYYILYMYNIYIYIRMCYYIYIYIEVYVYISIYMYNGMYIYSYIDVQVNIYKPILIAQIITKFTKFASSCSKFSYNLSSELLFRVLVRLIGPYVCGVGINIDVLITGQKCVARGQDKTLIPITTIYQQIRDVKIIFTGFDQNRLI